MSTRPLQDARDHRELQSQGGAAGTLLLQQLDVALRFLPTSEYGKQVPLKVPLKVPTTTVPPSLAVYAPCVA